jgi:hypothetical protein
MNLSQEIKEGNFEFAMQTKIIIYVENLSQIKVELAKLLIQLKADGFSRSN